MLSKNKYHNKKTVVDGITFDSKKESNRYSQLKLLEKAGEIVDLELQPKYLLQDKFKYNGETIRAIYYVSDFRYKHVLSGQIIVEDTKGLKTKDYLIKRKIFLKLYGNDVQFKEV